MTRSPILVTGSHRSGTTWVGSLLTAADGVAHLHEPLNPANRLSWLDVPPRHPFQYVGPDDPHGYGPAFDRMLEYRLPISRQLTTIRSPRNLAANAREVARSVKWRRSNPRALVKDPLSLMAAEWFADRYDAAVVLMVRHPAAFAGSLKRLDWRFDFGEFAAQPELMDGVLEPFADEIEAAAGSAPDLIDQAVLLWRCLNHTVAELADAHDDWILVRYEDLAADPLPGTRALYRQLDLDWTAGCEAAVRDLSSADHPAESDALRDVRRDSSAAMWTWQSRLDADEVDRVRAGTEDVAERFYDSEDWSSRSNSDS